MPAASARAKRVTTPTTQNKPPAAVVKSWGRYPTTRPKKEQKPAGGNMADLPLLLTMQETANVLRVARATLYRTHMGKPGGLKTVRMGMLRLVRRTDLERYIERLAA